ncbi:MAG: ectoine hydroxylase [Gammaproteobacteria bacterium]|jgi:ectoine hydroxylase
MDQLVDLYPSRVQPTPSIVDRTDPVVWDEAGAAEGPLDADRIAFFERKGYLAFEAFFPPEEVAAFTRELDAIWAAASESDDDTIVREPDNDVVRSVFAIHERNAVFRDLLRDRRLVAMAEQILGSQVYIHQSRINYKSGFRGKEFYWHSDFETWHTEDGMPRMRALSISIALSDNYALNGPLMLVPGSHKRYVTCTGATPDDHYKESLRRQAVGTPDDDSLRQLVDEGGIDAPTGPAGSIVLFDCNTMHGSGSNITPLPRSNIFAVYNSIENALRPPFAGTRPRPDFIANRIVDPIA